MIGSTVEALERFQRLEDSVVLIHSDHGFHNYPVGEVPLFGPVPHEIAEAVDSALDYTGFKGFLQRIHPLLLIRPPGTATRPIRISGATAQLVDIPVTIAHLVGISLPENRGVPVTTIVAGNERELQTFVGMNIDPFVHLIHEAKSGWAMRARVTVR